MTHGWSYKLPRNRLEEIPPAWFGGKLCPLDIIINFWSSSEYMVANVFASHFDDLEVVSFLLLNSTCLWSCSYWLSWRTTGWLKLWAYQLKIAKVQWDLLHVYHRRWFSDLWINQCQLLYPFLGVFFCWFKELFSCTTVMKIYIVVYFVYWLVFYVPLFWIFRLAAHCVAHFVPLEKVDFQGTLRGMKLLSR